MLKLKLNNKTTDEKATYAQCSIQTDNRTLSVTLVIPEPQEQPPDPNFAIKPYVYVDVPTQSGMAHKEFICDTEEEAKMVFAEVVARIVIDNSFEDVSL